MIRNKRTANSRHWTTSKRKSAHRFGDFLPNDSSENRGQRGQDCRRSSCNFLHLIIIQPSSKLQKIVDIRCNFICYIPVHHQHPCQFPVQLWPSLPNPQQLAPPQHREGVAHAHEPVQRLIKDIYSDRAALFTGTLCARTRIELDFANDVGSFDLLVFIESIKDEMKEFSTTKLIEIRDAAVAAWIAGKIRVSDRFLQRLELKDLWALDLNHGSIRIHRSAFIPVQELGLWSDQKYKFIRGGRIKHGQ